MGPIWYRIESIFSSPLRDWSPIIEIYRRFGMENTEQLSNGVVGYLKNKECLSLLEKCLKEKGAIEINLLEVPEEEWAESWKQYFKPKAIGQRFWIQPTWDKQSTPKNRLCIELDPGQAFGTGDHPTTKMCLVFLEKYVDPGATFIDIGCGSGILSIGACLLNASEVVAIDNDPISVEAAKENASLNKVQYEVYEGIGFAPISKDKKFDVIVSNIISAAIIELIPEALRFLKTEGKWIVSGIIKDNWKDVEKALLDFKLTIIEINQEGEWIAATIRR